MTPVIQQTARFQTTPQKLLELYLDSKKHTLATGVRAKIRPRVGGRFTAFNGQLEGKNVLLIPGKQIVQLWRATHWKKQD
jgi:activator of HSP90 ATPase